MYLLTEWQGWKYLARGYDLRTESSENRTSNSWPRAKYFPIRPDQIQSIRIFLNDHVEHMCTQDNH